ncbi:gelsolin, cytoplasmic-like isoform X1 [Tigriopus californicus]|uniref:gelsolin, cytoplasmic-like isoform X1 n=1 Tax=Tigriopus californicus TaxID=6832 RepID=UPI0027DA01A3|nr:gelsolin, cytoplasmic-like isoform X1 [Tigriopus californicus]XP_059094951.1 gelsolin, cytoplasmic-like isoform X1 [Tigriopus californicus]
MSFEGAGQEVGLEIWRIEDFEAVPYDKSKYGKFHTGDSYIVLNTFTKGSSRRLHRDIHFWLGLETSQDESGTAAIKSVELDDSLGGMPVQHREVQEHESALFLSYFKATGIKYLPGGVKTGFTHVDPEDVVKRLFQVKGKRNIKVKQVPMSPESMNKSDCFILDLGRDHDVLVYMPPGARKMERFKATQTANEIRDEDHAGEGTVEIIDEYGGSRARFFEELGSGSEDELPEAEGDDIEAEKLANREITLFRVSGTGENIEVVEVSGAPLKHGLLEQSVLQSEDCFILDTGSTTGIFAWIGKESNKEERVQAMVTAEAFLEKNGLPKWTRVERIVDGGETAMFKQYFRDWKEDMDDPCTGLGRFYPTEKIAEWDVSSMHAENRSRLARSAGAAIGFMPDDSTGKKEIFRIEDLEMVPLEEDKYGMFFGGDSYVIKYSYEKDGRNGYIIYFWQGAQSSQDEKAASAICAVQLDDQLSGKATQVRVTQGREPRHFIKMFGGKMVVFSGGKASGFKNVHDHDTYDTDGTRLFRVRGTCAEDVRAVQVEEKAASLNSDDTFILETPSKTFIWKGQGTSDDEKEIARGMIEVVSPGREVDEVEEGSETEAFWAGLGGQGDYDKGFNMNSPNLEPRLFHVSKMPNGKYRAFEFVNFEQRDLMSDDVMILDSGDEVYLWIGREADEEEKVEGLNILKEYVETDPTERSEKSALFFVVKEGEEPSSFTCMFPSFSQD